MATNNMMRYEALLLTVPEITSDEASTIESQLHSLLSATQGEVLSFERWGKYRLAYRVRNYEYGVYFLTRFEIPADMLEKTLEELRLLFAVKYRDVVMRFIFNKLEKSASLAYKRPESLEDAPRREGTGRDRMNRDFAADNQDAQIALDQVQESADVIAEVEKETELTQAAE